MGHMKLRMIKAFALSSCMFGASFGLVVTPAAMAQETPLPNAEQAIDPTVPAAPAVGVFQADPTTTAQNPPAKKAAPKKRRAAAKGVKKGSAARVAAATSRARVVLKDDPRPTFTPRTFLSTANAAQRYLDIVQAGGWPDIPKALSPGAKGDNVAALRLRLSMEGDLSNPTGDKYDEEVTAAVKQFQYRYGLTQNGVVSGATLEAINVPALVRFHQLNESARRMAGREFAFGDKYMVVNIPAASAEAIDNGRVTRRYVAVVGRPDRASPEVTAKINGVRFNPTWTVPKSIAQKDIIPKIMKNPGTLASMNLKVLDGKGKEVNASKVKWSEELTAENPRFTIRQEPGRGNSLGAIRINMPNSDAVYMHDTPHKELFGGDFRFNSSGCVRVEGIKELAEWLLADQGYDQGRINKAIAEKDLADHPLSRDVPVTWVYLTGFVTEDGLVNFRDDIYGLDVPRFAAR
jgi:L,D-transpeptidase YcbB